MYGKTSCVQCALFFVHERRPDAGTDIAWQPARHFQQSFKTPALRDSTASSKGFCIWPSLQAGEESGE